MSSLDNNLFTYFTQNLRNIIPTFRYLIAKDENGKAVGLSHFRFDLDNDIEVLYWYMLQFVLFCIFISSF